LSQTPPNQNRSGWFLAREIVDQVMQLPIATLDGDLAEAAWAAGVGVMPE
jgi:hypothetical protein